MKMEFILHIGFPKTATTWFQEKFYPQVKNIHYFDRKVIEDKILSPGAYSFDPKMVSSFFKDISVEKNVICEDRLIGSLNAWHNGLFTREYASRLKQLFPGAKIILFIRNPLDMLVALYSQYLHHGGNYSIRKFMYHEKNTRFTLNNQFLFSFESLDYSSMINQYAELFGREKVCLYMFEDLARDPPDFLNGFTREHEFAVDPGEIDFKPVNTGYRYFLYPFARIANAFTSGGFFYKYYLVHIPKWYEYSHSALRWLNRFRLFGAKPTPMRLLGKRQVQDLSERFDRMNRSLLNRFPENKLKEYGYIN